MLIQFNGKSMTLLKPELLSDLLQRYGIDACTSGIAVAVNEEIIIRMRWSELTIRDNDNIEIIHAVQGG